MRKQRFKIGYRDTSVGRDVTPSVVGDFNAAWRAKNEAPVGETRTNISVTGLKVVKGVLVVIISEAFLGP